MPRKYANSIQRQYAAIFRASDVWAHKLKVLQTKCKHKAAVKVPRSNSGNWDRSDHYWYECKCPDCHKFWTEDQ